MQKSEPAVADLARSSLELANCRSQWRRRGLTGRSVSGWVRVTVAGQRVARRAGITGVMTVGGRAGIAGLR